MGPLRGFSSAYLVEVCVLCQMKCHQNAFLRTSIDHIIHQSHFFPSIFPFFVHASLPLPIKFSPNVIMKNKHSRSAPMEGGTSVYPRQGFSPTRCGVGEEAQECRANKTNFKGCAFLILKVYVNTVEHFRLNPRPLPSPLNVAPMKWL